jgi:hypothetical protein
MKPSPQDWFGAIIGLEVTLAELHEELTVDVITQNPRTIMLAVGGLRRKVSDIIDRMKSEMENDSQSETKNDTRNFCQCPDCCGDE